MTDQIDSRPPAANDPTKAEGYVDPVALIAALVTGDRWLSADACAVYLGGITRRTFLETIACKPSFPMALKLGKVKVWKKSEIETWAMNYRSSKVSRVA